MNDQTETKIGKNLETDQWVNYGDMNPWEHGGIFAQESSGTCYMFGGLEGDYWTRAAKDYRLSKVLLSEALKELGERYDLRTHKHFFTEEQLDQIENIKYF